MIRQPSKMAYIICTYGALLVQAVLVAWLSCLSRSRIKTAFLGIQTVIWIGSWEKFSLGSLVPLRPPEQGMPHMENSKVFSATSLFWSYRCRTILPKLHPSVGAEKKEEGSKAQDSHSEESSHSFECREDEEEGQQHYARRKEGNVTEWHRCSGKYAWWRSTNTNRNNTWSVRNGILSLDKNQSVFSHYNI